MWITDETLVLPVTNPKQTGISFARGAFLLVNLVHISRRSYHLRNFFNWKIAYLYLCVQAPMRATVCAWRSEDKLWTSVSSFYPMGAWQQLPWCTKSSLQLGSPISRRQPWFSVHFFISYNFTTWPQSHVHCSFGSSKSGRKLPRRVNHFIIVSWRGFPSTHAGLKLPFSLTNFSLNSMTFGPQIALT